MPTFRDALRKRAQLSGATRGDGWFQHISEVSATEHLLRRESPVRHGIATFVAFAVSGGI